MSSKQRSTEKTQDLQDLRERLFEQVESLLEDAASWLELKESAQAHLIYEKLEAAYELLAKDSSRSDQEHSAKTEAEIDEELKQSFPASDPPSNY